MSGFSKASIFPAIILVGIFIVRNNLFAQTSVEVADHLWLSGIDYVKLDWTGALATSAFAPVTTGLGVSENASARPVRTWAGMMKTMYSNPGIIFLLNSAEWTYSREFSRNSVNMVSKMSTVQIRPTRKFIASLFSMPPILES